MAHGGRSKRRTPSSVQLHAAPTAQTTCLGNILLIVLLLGTLSTASGQNQATINFVTPPTVTLSYTWKVTKSAGGGAGGASFTAVRGRSIDIPFTIVVDRQLDSTPTSSLDIDVTCPPPPPGVAPPQVTLSQSGSNSPLGSSSTAGSNGIAQFRGIPWPKAPGGAITTQQDTGSIIASCSYGAGQPVQSAPTPVVFLPANVKEVRGTATIKDDLKWPDWPSFYPAGGWLNRAPVVQLTLGSDKYPGSGGTPVRGPFPTTYSYTWTVSNLLLCVQGAQVRNTAIVTTDGMTYSADATATITVTDCDVKPAITTDQPQLLTTLTYAWTQALAPVSSPALTFPWGGGGTVQAQATFTRTVTSSNFKATFTLQVGNPSPAPIAVTNLQLSCPWGGNVLLPCGLSTSNTIIAVPVSSGSTATPVNTASAAGNWLVIEGSSTFTCPVMNLDIPARWGSDFTQPCTILASDWRNNQLTMAGMVLNFAGPQRWITINNCAMWSVTCSVPTGNVNYVPNLGGLPTGQQVCGSEQSNAPMPPQPFGIAFSAGWVGDGTQPGACASPVTSTCTSSLQMQSTAGTTQGVGGTTTATLTVQATPTDCPKPTTPQLAPGTVVPGGVIGPNGVIIPGAAGVLLPSPSPDLRTKAVEPLVVAQVTKTYIRGTFTWSVSSSITPANQVIPLGNQGVLGRYSVTATPQAVAGEASSYQIEGVVSVTNPDPLSSLRVDEVYVVVDNAAVPLTCRPVLPGMFSPGARADCPFLVNYNQGGAPNTLLGRAVVVSDWGVRRPAESSPVRFTFDASDVSQARGACARVSQTFATNWFDLVQATGVAPSFDPDQPTTVCSPSTWNFDVRFTVRSGAPCGVQQAVQTVNAAYSQDTSGTARASSTANLYIATPTCPPPPPDFTSGSDLAAGLPPLNSAPATPPPAASTTAPATGGSSDGSVTTEAGQQQGPLPPGLSVAVSGVQSQRSATAGWDVGMDPVLRNVSFTRGTPAVVAFSLNFTKTKTLTDHTGNVTIYNNAPSAAELDGVFVNMVDSMNTGDATDETTAECPRDASGIPQRVSSGSTLTIPANGQVTCSFTLRSASSGSLLATITAVNSEDGIVSKPVPVMGLMADSTCGKLVSGLAASDLGQQGVLKGSNGTTEEEVCSGANKVVSFAIPADAPADRGCVIPVVSIAWMRPVGIATSAGQVAVARADVRVAGCTTPLDAAASATIPRMSTSKGRALRWVVNLTTDPAVNGTFSGSSLDVTTLWQQRSESGLRLNVSGEVAVKGSAAAAQAKVFAIPLCSATDNATDCSPVMFPASCRPSLDSADTSRCVFNFTRLPFQPGLLLPVVDAAAPAAAQYYDPGRAAYGGRPAPLCAVLTEQRSLTSPAAAVEARVEATGAAALPTGPFCGMSFSSNYTLTFSGVECGKDYNFTAQASATPVVPGSLPVNASLAMNVTC